MEHKFIEQVNITQNVIYLTIYRCQYKVFRWKI